jgi:hypothetical protein
MVSIKSPSSKEEKMITTGIINVGYLDKKEIDRLMVDSIQPNLKDSGCFIGMVESDTRDWSVDPKSDFSAVILKYNEDWIIQIMKSRWYMNCSYSEIDHECGNIQWNGEVKAYCPEPDMFKKRELDLNHETYVWISSIYHQTKVLHRVCDIPFTAEVLTEFFKIVNKITTEDIEKMFFSKKLTEESLFFSYVNLINGGVGNWIESMEKEDQTIFVNYIREKICQGF